MFFDVEKLRTDPDVLTTLTETEAIGNRPFLCVEADDSSSDWSPLTTETSNPMRVKIKQEWKRGDERQWMEDPQSLNDGRNVWRGPNSSFVAASHLERTTKDKRSFVVKPGVDEVRAEIEQRRNERDIEIDTAP